MKGAHSDPANFVQQKTSILGPTSLITKSITNVDVITDGKIDEFTTSIDVIADIKIDELSRTTKLMSSLRTLTLLSGTEKGDFYVATGIV